MCVEMHDLKSEILNGKRGIVVGTCANQDRINVRLIQKQTTQHETVSVQKKNVCSVFCLGLPRECYMIVKEKNVNNIHQAYSAALSSLDASKFYVAHAGFYEEGHCFLKIRLPFFTMVLDKIRKLGKEPLLRVYAANYSQDDADAKILFQNEMLNWINTTGFVDFDSKEVQKIQNGVGLDSNLSMEVDRVDTATLDGFVDISILGKQ